jgi:hypothetical protein
VISISRLTEILVDDWVVFDERGGPVDTEVPVSTDAAALLVTPMTDAVKRVDDGVVHSLDRDRMWVVEAIILNRMVLDRLGEETMSFEELFDAVRGLGHSWQINPVVVP